MGSYDGAESCELVGAFLLHKIKEKHGNNFGLYRDDGLGITNATPRQVELIKKDLCTIFSEHGLKITIEANKKNRQFPRRHSQPFQRYIHALYQAQQYPTLHPQEI